MFRIVKQSKFFNWCGYAVEQLRRYEVGQGRGYVRPHTHVFWPNRIDLVLIRIVSAVYSSPSCSCPSNWEPRWQAPLRNSPVYRWENYKTRTSNKSCHKWVTLNKQNIWGLSLFCIDLSQFDCGLMDKVLL